MPPVVLNLMIINGLLLLLKLSMDSDELGRNTLDTLLGLHVIGSPDFKPWQFITHMFMHAGPGSEGWFLHIGMNMFALFMFGAPVERLWGGKRFLQYYLLCGLGAAALHLGVNYLEVTAHVNAFQAAGGDLQAVKQAVTVSHTSLAEANKVMNDMLVRDGVPMELATQVFFDYSGVMVGASGAVFGILLAFGMMFPNVELMLLFFPFPIKAKYFVVLYGLFELFAGLQQRAGDNVAHFAHLGGMIFGFFMIRHWKRRMELW
ncbi:MAG: rhomboid family intramembrane serine protease [Flavobacteriales bacterium]|nr:rhomboid family intramembrane serine protease [Flavobacteriales bacterium]